MTEEKIEETEVLLDLEPPAADEVSLLESDLQLIQQALNAAYYKGISEDLIKAYNSLTETPSYCPLTLSIGEVLEKVNTLLNVEDEVPEKPDDA